MYYNKKDRARSRLRFKMRLPKAVFSVVSDDLLLLHIIVQCNVCSFASLFYEKKGVKRSPKAATTYISSDTKNNRTCSILQLSPYSLLHTITVFEAYVVLGSTQ